MPDTLLLQSAKILIADDCHIFRNLVKMALRPEIEHFIEAENGKDVLDLYLRHSPDLIMLDVMMPGESGIDVCGAVRRGQIEPDLPILMVTSLGDRDSIELAFEAGADDFLTKPVNILVLKHKVLRLLQLRNNRRRLQEIEHLVSNSLDHWQDHVAVIDDSGKILAVNNAWRRYAESSGNVSSNYGVGSNYLSVCEKARDGGVEQADLVIGGILGVVEGKTPEYTQAYPCHGPRRKQWFRFMASRWPDPEQTAGGSIIIRHVDVTQESVLEILERDSGIPPTSALETPLSGLILVNGLGAVVFANANMADISGHPVAELHKFRFGKLFSPFSRRLLRPLVREALANGGKNFQCEAHLVRKNGQYLPVALRVFPLFGEGVVAVSVDDISARRKAEEFLRQSKEESLATLDSIEDMILVETSTGELRRCNKAVSRFTSRPAEELIGRTTTEVLFGDQPDAPRFHLLAKEHPHETISREIVFPGRPDFYELRSYWIPQERGIGSSWVHILKNITPLKKAEKEMKLLMAVAEQTTDMVAILDLKGQIRYLNPSLENLIGRTRGEFLNKSYRKLRFRPCDWRQHRQIRRQARAGEALTGDYQFRKSDGSMHFLDVLVSPLNDQEQANLGFIVIGRDITHRKRLESIAEAVNVMENVGYIFSGIRHEMGNPINSIKISLAVLKQNYSQGLSEEVLQYVNRSLEEVERVEFLLKALRSFSMHEDVNVEPTRLNSALEQFCELARVDFAKNDIRIESRIPARDVVIGCDARALHQILLNLFTNAAQAMEKREVRTIRVELETVGEFARILVHDTGTGLSEAQLELLFKPFHTSKPEGTGLGLVIVKKMVTKMNGTIDIKSRPGRGTTVILTFETLK